MKSRYVSLYTNKWHSLSINESIYVCSLLLVNEAEDHSTIYRMICKNEPAMQSYHVILMYCVLVAVFGTATSMFYYININIVRCVMNVTH